MNKPARFDNLRTEPICMGATEKQHSLVFSFARVPRTFLLVGQLWLR